MNWSEIFEYKDGELFWKIKRKKARPGMIAGDKDAYGYRRTTYKYKCYKVHRIIWEMHFGPICGGLVIDHINGIIGDNHIENLRLATVSQNTHNRKVSSRNLSGIKGVYPCEKNTPRKPWMASIMVHGKRIFLGAFKTKEEAGYSYAFAENKYYGSFSRTGG